MESSVTSFALTLTRQLADVEATLAKIGAQEESVEEIDIADVDTDDLLSKASLWGERSRYPSKMWIEFAGVRTSLRIATGSILSSRLPAQQQPQLTDGLRLPV
jgi:hypothetical protein